MQSLSENLNWNGADAMLTVGYGTAWEQANPTGFPIDGVMLAEHTHRVTNDLTMAIAALETCHRRVDGSAARDALKVAIERLRQIAVVQRFLARPRDLEVDLGALVSGLSRAILLAYSGSGRIGLNLRLDSVRTGSDFAWRLSTVLAEVVVNAVKHGFADRDGSIDITLASRSGGVSCTVSDDGGGAGDWQSKGSGRGCGIVDAIVTGLGGTAVRETSAAGTRVTMDFPIIHNNRRLAN